MINTVLKGLWAVLAICLLFFLAWLIVALCHWPLWAILPLAIALALLWSSGKWLHRYWRSWRLKRSLNTTSIKGGASHYQDGFDELWNSGLQQLRSGLLGRKKGSFYALPWVLMLDVVPYESNDELNQLAIQQVSRPESVAGLSWWFLRAAVVLRFPVLWEKNINAKTQAHWQLLLKKLFKTRRREPLNGVIFNINSTWLSQADPTELYQLGVGLRAQMDEINHLFSARIPCWVVLSQSQHVTGLNEFAEQLDAEQRDAFFGYFSDSSPVPMAALIDHAMDATQHRCFDLSLRLGQVGGSLNALGLAQCLEVYRTQLRTIFIPAFDSSPYAVDPLCKGVFWTATSSSSGSPKTWFSEQLYERLIPLQRYAWVAVDRLGPWRRLLQQMAVVVWLLMCLGGLAFLLYAARDVKRVIDTTAERQSTVLDFSGQIDSDLVSLNILHDITLELDRNTKGLFSYLPFRSEVNRLNRYYKTNFSKLYQTEIRDDFMNGVLFERYPIVVQQGSAQDIAAWAQYLVRRINLIQAQLKGQDLRRNPLIGNEIAYIYDRVGVHEGVQAGVLVGQLYPDYLRWSNDETELQNELDNLRFLLRQLNLGHRNIDWLLAWVDLQNGLKPITLANFWPIRAADKGPVIPAGLTRAGAEAIQAFVNELAAASEQSELWQERQSQMAQIFTEASYNAWYSFVADFDLARQYLTTESSWSSVLSQSLTSDDPYLKLLRTLSHLFSDIPIETRPDWINTAIDLERLIQASRVIGSSEKGWLDHVRFADELGRVGLGVMKEGVSIERSAEIVLDGATAVDLVKAYETTVREAIQDLLVGSGNAMQLAQQTWSYGYAPTVTSSLFHQAQQYFVDLRVLVGHDGARDNAIWRVANGPLSLALEYAALSAACGLQKEWETQVLSVVEYVHSPILAQELLYGEGGSVELFTQGNVMSFVERNRNAYRARKALGLEVPLSGEFLAYLNTIQGQRISGRVDRFEQEAKARRAQLSLDQAQQQEKEIKDQLAEIGSQRAVIRIETVPPLLNSGAKETPYRTQLSLQCLQHNQLLENYNFPLQKSFDWQQDQCGNVVLSFDFPEWSISKSFAGPLGIFDFLQRFEQGAAVFTASDFPGQESRLASIGVDSIRLNWHASGYTNVLTALQEKNHLEKELGHVQQRIATAQEAKAGPDVLSAAPVRVQDLVPERIVRQCWHNAAVIYSPALDEIAVQQLKNLELVQFEVKSNEIDMTESIAQSEHFPWRVQVGVFSNADKALHRLTELGFQAEVSSLNLNGQAYQQVKAVGFSSQAQAQEAAAKINQSLQLLSQVQRAP